jgi:predicted AlkP superfamily pyrophosphatase or phosphodiesterase
MLNLQDQILPILRTHKIPRLDTGPSSIHPHYEGYSLVNLPSSVCKLFNIPVFGAPPLNQNIISQLDQNYEHIVFLLADGLRFDFFREALTRQPWADFAAPGLLSPLTSITPSTTSAALTTLWTGSHPSEHGILGYEVWLREYGVIANMILHSAFTFAGDIGGLKRAGFDPTTFLPVPTLGPHLKQHGIESYAIQHSAIAHSGLSKMLFPDVNILPYRSNADLLVNLQQLLEKRKGQRTYAYVYWELIDSLSHLYGPDDIRNTLEFDLFSQGLIQTLRTIQKQSNGKTLFILTADHGHIHTPILDHYDLTKRPEINQHLTMVPTGENRLPYLFPRTGHEDELLSLINKVYGDDFLPIRSADAIQQGLFGNGTHHPMLADRLGDWILIPQNDAYLWWWWQKENPLLGRHGGLSPQEMLVPFFALAL